jgi:hypothetical protein
MNTKRIVIAGIGAGVVVWIVDCVANAVVLRDRYPQLVKAGIFLEQPRLPFFPLWTLVMLGLGLGLAWLYAAVRPRLGPGPKTAAAIGFVVGLMIYTPSNLAQASWSMAGRFVPFVWFVFGIIGTVAGALVAGALYKEEPANPGSKPS